MTNLIVRRSVNPIDWTGVPETFKGRCSAVCRTAEECNDLISWFGDADFCPFKPVLLMVPGAQVPILIIGDGYATAAELRDCAVVGWHRQLEKLAANNGAPLNFDELRERRGLMRREDVDAAVRQALRDKAEAHKAAPVTNPMRQPVYPNPTNRTLHKVAK